MKSKNIFLAVLAALSILICMTGFTANTATEAKSKEATVNTGMFAGYNITVLDSATPAANMRGRTNDRDVMCFVSADDKELGVISHSDYNAIIQKNRRVIKLPGGGTWGAPPIDGKSWEEWFADEFNRHRGLGKKAQQTKEPEHSNAGITGNNNPDKSTNSGAKHPNDREDTTNFSATRIDIEAARDEIIRKTNAEREKAGLPDLVVDQNAMDFAQARAYEISTHFSHVRPNGKRVSEYGYGENIGPGHPDWAVGEWMSSPGHKANILHERYSVIGVGVYQDEDGFIAGVQVFSSKPRKTIND